MPDLKDLRDFNINGYFRIKLKDRGEAIYWKYFTDLGLPAREPKVDQDGWVTMTAWEVFQIFGPHIYHGCDVPFETTIQISFDPL